MSCHCTIGATGRGGRGCTTFGSRNRSEWVKPPFRFGYRAAYIGSAPVLAVGAPADRPDVGVRLLVPPAEATRPPGPPVAETNTDPPSRTKRSPWPPWITGNGGLRRETGASHRGRRVDLSAQTLMATQGKAAEGKGLKPSFPKRNRVSSAARPTVSGYLPVRSIAWMSGPPGSRTPIPGCKPGVVPLDQQPIRVGDWNGD